MKFKLNFSRILSGTFLVFFVFSFLVVNGLDPTKIFADDTPGLNQLVKVTWVADNQVKVEYPKGLTADGYNVANEPGASGIFTDSDPTDPNREFTSGQDQCGGKQIGKFSQDAIQSKVSNQGGQWRIQIAVDTNKDDVSTGCNPIFGVVDAPGGDVGALRDQGYWIDRSKIKYKNDIYTVHSCFPWHPKNLSGDRNKFLNSGNVDDYINYASNIAGEGGELVYVSGDGNTKRLLADTSSAGGLMTAKNGGAAFLNLNVVEDGYRNAATGGYKLDENTILASCGLKTTGFGDIGVEKAMYNKPAQDDPQVQGHPDLLNKYFRIENGARQWQDWIQISGGPNARIHTSNNGGAKFEYDLILANNGDIADPPEEIYGKKADLINQANTGNNTTGNGSTADTHVDCQTGGLSLNPLELADHAISWILCPLLDGAQAIVNSVGGWVVDQLEFDVNGYLLNPINDKDGKPTHPIKDAWNVFRIMSLSLVVLVALAGILLSSFIDAYTYKKILPRILIAIIAISLSWNILVLVIQVVNTAGVGVRQLINAPFVNLKPVEINPLIIVGGAGVAAGLTTIMGALSLVGTAALAVLFAFIFTILRTAAIIMFIIFAPVAILLWILPGTQKGWNFWQSGLTGALIMFPIVTAFLAIGAAFGKILYSMNVGGPALAQTMALVATYAPYFLIPKAFTMAGGVVANLSGMVNDKGRGAFDRLKKYRQGQGEKRRHDIKGGNFFRGGVHGNRRGKFNELAQGATLIGQAGLRPSGWRDNMRRAMGNTEAHESEEIMKSVEGRLLQDDDVATAYIRSGGNEQEFRRILQERAYKRFGGDENIDALDHASHAMMALSKANGHGAVRLAALRTKFNSSTGWGNDWEYETEKNTDGSVRRDAQGKIVFKTDEKGERKIAEDEHGNKKVWKYNASGKMLEEINMIAGGNRALSTQLLAEARTGQTRAGREDTGGGGFSDTAVEMDKLWRGDAVKVTDANGEVMRDANGIEITREYSLEDATEKVTESLINGKPIHEIFRSGKPAVARAVAPVLKKMTAKKLVDNKQLTSKRIDTVRIEAQNEVERIRTDVSIPDPQKNDRIQQVRRAEQAQLTQIVADQEKVAIRTLAQEQMMHAVAASSSTDSAQAMGDQVFTAKFEASEWESIPEPVKQKIIAKVGNNPTRGQAYEALRDDETWGAYVKEYGRVGGGRVINEAEVAAHAEQQGISAAQARAALEAQARAEAEANQPHP